MPVPSRARRTALRAVALLCAAACGCDNCEKLRKTQVRSLPWDTFYKKCVKCLNSEELAALQREKQLYDRVGLTDLFGEGKTVQEVLSEAANLSAYESSPSLPALPPTTEPVPPQAAEAQSGPWVIPESVLFLYSNLTSEDGSVYRLPSATGFVLCVPHRKDGSPNENAFVRFLVTARHVLDPEWGRCSQKNPTAITVRMNKRSGGVGYETIPLEQNHKRTFFTPADNTSDVAVIFLDRRLIPNLDSYKFIDVPFRLMPTASELQALHADQKILTAGLLPEFPGDQENLPIFREGILSNTPNEPVSVRCDVTSEAASLHVWFVSATLPRGVSGAPVFSIVNRGVGAERAPILLGVQSIAWPDKNVGGITPASVLADFVQTMLETAKFPVDFYRGPEKRSCGGN